MCAALMNLGRATDGDIRAAIDSKLKKFGSIQTMPEETRALVMRGQAELDRRNIAPSSDLNADGPASPLNAARALKRGSTGRQH